MDGEALGNGVHGGVEARPGEKLHSERFEDSLRGDAQTAPAATVRILPEKAPICMNNLVNLAIC